MRGRNLHPKNHDAAWETPVAIAIIEALVLATVVLIILVS